MFLNPDHLIRAYYESLGKLASPAALTITGMPQTESSADYLHTRHGDLVWAMRGLTEQHMLVLGMRFAAASGVRDFLRPREVPRLEFTATMHMDPEAWQELQQAMEPHFVAHQLDAARLYAFECVEEAQRMCGFVVVQRDPMALIRALFALGLATIEPIPQANASSPLAAEPAHQFPLAPETDLE